MKITISIIKADVGSVGGHEIPSKRLIETIENHVKKEGKRLLLDYKIFHTGDDTGILMSHIHGVNYSDIHKLAFDAFVAGTEVAKEQGLYGAGQDILKNAFSGNVRGMGPGSCEMEFEERPAEPFVLFACDKTDPGAFNYPLFRGFADPFHNAGLLLASDMAKGFEFTVMDVNYTKGDRVITLKVPEEYYDLAVLLRDPEHFVIESISSRATGDIASVVSTSRLHNIAGKYTGKDDPVAIVRTQKQFPSTGELLSPYATAHFVAGGDRGSHIVALMPCKLGAIISFFDGPAIVTAAGMCVHNGIFTEAIDLFDQPFWDTIRDKASEKTYAIREQGFFGAAMAPMEELEYTGVVERIKQLDSKFSIRRSDK
uniref:Fructose-1,6-bisphosphate aldolase/phosphatase n=1 Tax=uncultured Microgenomates group bacterium TaxID=174293 RepID=A0A447ITT3_9BACT|nr:Fructose-1,6-bisphosphate aldolase/phosphatase [uncultured Microgenomates group bacterium]VDS10914.1 Fructose-1,6-bisphosphate aldolase/phosphatase [uncultured Microgenomates group bacterium]